MEQDRTPEPAEPLGTKATTTGAVKWYRKDKGIGCIATDATAPWDIWFYFTMVEGVDEHPRVKEGQSVEVDYERANQDSFRYRAISVRPQRSD